MLDILQNINESAHIDTIMGWMVITYGAVFGACVIDLACGIYKAVKSGIATTSTGLRKTCTKAQHYFIPMLCLSFADFLASAVLDFPPFTMAWGAFCVMCEFKSVLEKSATKEQIREAANTMGVVIKNKDDLARALVEIMRDMDDEQKKAGKPRKPKKHIEHDMH